MQSLKLVLTSLVFSGAGGATCAGPSTTSPTSAGARPGIEQLKKVWKTPRATNVNIVLVEGKDLLAMDLEGTSDPYCKFR